MVVELLIVAALTVALVVENAEIWRLLVPKIGTYISRDATNCIFSVSRLQYMTTSLQYN